MNNLPHVLAAIAVSLIGCVPMAGRSTPPAPPTPMSDGDALAYARAHPYTGGKMMTAVNNLDAPVCRIVILSETGRDDRALIGKQYVNQAGATDPERGSLDPSDQPLLQLHAKSPVFYPNVPDPQPPQMVVTAFGCLRTREGEFFTDERTVLMQKRMVVAVNGTMVLGRR